MLLEAWKEFEVSIDEFIVQNDLKSQLCTNGENSRESATRRSLNAWNARETLPRKCVVFRACFPRYSRFQWLLRGQYIFFLVFNQDIYYNYIYYLG